MHDHDTPTREPVHAGWLAADEESYVDEYAEEKDLKERSGS